MAKNLIIFVSILFLIGLLNSFIFFSMGVSHQEKKNEQYKIVTEKLINRIRQNDSFYDTIFETDEYQDYLEVK